MRTQFKFKTYIRRCVKCNKFFKSRYKRGKVCDNCSKRPGVYGSKTKSVKGLVTKEELINFFTDYLKNDEIKKEGKAL